MNEFDDTRLSAADDEALMAKARALAADVQPERDLWPGVAAAIAEPADGFERWRRPLLQAAAVFVLVGASAALVWLNGDEAPELSPVVATNAPPLDAASANFSGWAEFDVSAQDARRDVEQRLEQRLEHLSPATRREVTTNLQTIRSAIADINAALADEPDNALLQELLLSSYDQELALMRQVNDIGLPMMMREDI